MALTTVFVIVSIICFVWAFVSEPVNGSFFPSRSLLALRVHLGQPSIVQSSDLILNECDNILECGKLMSAAGNLCSDIIRKNADKEFFQMLRRHVGCKTGLCTKPFSNVCLKMFEIFALWKRME